MNSISFWIDRSLFDNILFYNAENFDLEDLKTAIKKTETNIVILYNLYVSIEEKNKIIKETEMPHFLYTKSDLKKDSGILVLSYFSIFVYVNKIYPILSNRIARMISFTIKRYMFKIEMNPKNEENGYHFNFVFINKNPNIVNSKKEIKSKIILLRAGSDTDSFKEK